MAKIRIIDDDLEVSETVATILRKAGHEVSLLNSTDNAVSVLIEDKPDLVILDIMFPDNPAAGFDLAREVRQHGEIEDLPIILLTGMNQEFPMDFSARDIDPEWMPVQDFVEKPVNAELLLAAVQKMLPSA